MDKNEWTQRLAMAVVTTIAVCVCVGAVGLTFKLLQWLF